MVYLWPFKIDRALSFVIIDITTLEILPESLRAFALLERAFDAMSLNKLLIIDFGSQVTQLIARRVRENGVYSEIHPFHKVDAAFLAEYAPKAIILSGGPASVTGADSPFPDKAVYDFGVPILGICYGQQALCSQLGGEVTPAEAREFGRAELNVSATHTLFEGWEAKEQVWMSHGDSVDKLPEGFEILAHTDNCPYAAIAHDERRIYGVQFHPEVVHTLKGSVLLSNFIHKIVGLQSDWTMAAYRQEAVQKIKSQVGDAKVICGLSGGVDSSVAAVLIHEAIGDQLTCVFVDTGLMRLNEADEVVGLFRDHYNIPLIHKEAGDLFMGELEGESDPEKKRKTIGRLFIDVFDEASKEIGGAEFLAQGTLYPDVIESVSAIGGPSVTIKSHHNVGGLPDYMKLKLVEPLRELFKDEVRALGRELGLPDSFVGRHPFPGPGLGIRIPGAVTKERVKTLQKADAIYIEEIKKAGLYDKIWQAFSVLLPVNTVGVMGDERTYENALALRAVTSTDGMTADYYPFEHEFLAHVATRIINEVRGVNRVTYDITSKPPGTIEWE